MSSKSNAFGVMQKLGKALMLPVSVLPVAGILLGVGSSKFWWIPGPVSQLMADSGGAIFGQLPLLFAIGVALGLAKDGVAALAATVGYFVMTATLKTMAYLRELVTTGPAVGEHQAKLAEELGILKKYVMVESTEGLIDTGVFGGIIIGAIAAVLFNKYYRIQLPNYLGFFAGKRFVPIATAFAAILLGIVLSYIWPPFQDVIDAFSNWATGENTTLAVFIYGFIERSLIPFGLHHIWNVPFYFEMGSFDIPGGGVATGDIERFMKGDPTAGILGGAYLFKMFGLPAAAIAIWHTAKPEQRVKVGGMMVSAALTSFLTGITEPIEFSFMFVAPLLYLLHAFLAGTCFMVFNICGGLMGTSFSHGLIDLSILWAKGTKPWLAIVLGLVYAGIYYGLFRYLITKFDIKTPGREDVDLEAVAATTGEGGLARLLVLAFGGRSNITALDACITRLRISVADPKLACKDKLKALGASGVLVMGNNLQAIFGPQSENLKTDMELYLQSAGDDADLSEEEKAALVSAQSTTGETGTTTQAQVDPKAKDKAQAWLQALGGTDNIKSTEACAVTRLRVEVKDSQSVDEKALTEAGVQAVMKLDDGVLHLVVGQQAEQYQRELKKL